MSVIKHGEVTVSYQHTGFIERVGVKTGPNGVAVLRALLDSANLKTRECRPSIATICARTALSESTVKRALGALSEHGFVAVNKRAAESGRQLCNSYTIMDRKLVESEGPKLMIRALKSYGRRSFAADAQDSSSEAEGFTQTPLELNVLESKAKGVKATALDLASGLRPSTKSRHEPAADAGGYVRPEAGSPNDHGQDEPKPKPRSAFKRTAHGWWIPVEPVFCQKRRNTNGAKTKTTATSKTEAATTSRATSADAHPAPPRGAGSAHVAGAGPRSVADPTRDTPAAPNAAHRPRQRAPRPTDPFFNLFGELVLKGQPTSRDRGLAGEFASRCVGNQVTERALRDWRHDLTVTGEAKFLRPYNAWAMFAPWWDKRIGKYIETPGMPSELERFGGAGSGEQWAHIRYGLTAER